MADATCTIPGCNRLIKRYKGLCGLHYDRKRRYGDPLRTPPRLTLEERFWSKVDKTEGCWFWTGAKGKRGYGHFNIGGKIKRAHCVAYELLVGPIPPGMTLDHVKANGCTSTSCVKAVVDEHGPAHLEPVTQRTNIMRGEGPTAQNAQKEACLRGHLFDIANTYFRSDGGRRCRACRRWRDLRSRETKKGCDYHEIPGSTSWAGLVR